MAKYVYPAIFTHESNGAYSVKFPDLENCFTGGEDLTDALEMAEDALCLVLYDAEETEQLIPAPSEVKQISTGENEFVTLVSCDTLEYRRLYHSNAVKKTLSIPSWLNTMAEKQGVNFSQVLQTALKQQLKIEEMPF